MSETDFGVPQFSALENVSVFHYLCCCWENIPLILFFGPLFSLVYFLFPSDLLGIISTVNSMNSVNNGNLCLADDMLS